MKTVDAARGKWRGILLALGVNKRHLTGKHGPCPMCEGNDRFRWDNKNGNGSYICSQCGAGDGIKFLMAFHGWTFQQAASEVDKIVGNVQAEPAKPPMDEAAIAASKNRAWSAATPVTPDDLAGRYLAGRGVLPASIPACLRFLQSCPVPGGGEAPAMLAMVHGPDGVPVTLHRTFLGPNGKADLPEPRAAWAGPHPVGSAVRLSPVVGGRLGIAEGIETALAASKRFQLPVWAALNSTQLAGWVPPQQVSEVVVFGDCDDKFGGQAAAFNLAHRLKVRLRLDVAVQIPNQLGKDWADADAA